MRWGLEHLDIDRARIRALGMVRAAAARDVVRDHGVRIASACTWDGATLDVRSDWYESDAALLRPLLARPRRRMPRSSRSRRATAASSAEEAAMKPNDIHDREIVRAGEAISAREVEACLILHPKVKDARCVGVPDDRHGEELCACIVLRPGEVADPEEIRAFCRGRIAYRKLPRHVRFLDAFPTTSAGWCWRLLRRRMAADLVHGG